VPGDGGVDRVGLNREKRRLRGVNIIAVVAEIVIVIVVVLSVGMWAVYKVFDYMANQSG
jgi:hypothetical protein